MKKAILFAASFLAMAAFASCNKTADEPELVTYTLTVDANRGDDITKALSLSGSTLNATWGASDVVTVYRGTSSIGTLRPQSTGSASAVLKGSITTSGLSAGTELRLLGPRSSWLYDGQTGSLSTLSSKYAYVQATVSVTAVNGSDVSTGKAEFENQQAVVKFSLKDASGKAVYPDELLISTASGKLVKSVNSSLSALTGDLSIVPDDDISDFYVALRNDSGAADTYNLTVTAGKTIYHAQKSGVLFQNGKYYAGTVTLEEETHTYTVAGSPASVFGVEWDPADTGNDMVKQSDGTYKKTYTLTAAKTDLAFKVVQDHAWDNAWPAENYTASAGKGTLVITFDPSTNTVSATYPDPPADYQDTYTIAGDPASVFGTAWDPANTANDMVLQSDGNFAKTYSAVPAGTALTFKVVVNHDWSLNYGANGVKDGPNVGYTMKATKNLTITFNPTTHIISASEN